jgi:hypothetical protein
MKRNNLTAAVLAGLVGAAGIVGSAQAVNQNPDGLGQVLIYPYYTTNGGNQTILSVVNTTDSAKAVKVRFLEGQNSQEVLDFNLYLSEHDVWVAAIADDGAGTPTLYIPDNSCTVPYLYGDGPLGVQPFLNFAYSGDGGSSDISRATEGHFEMIEMGTIIDDSDTEDSVTHADADAFDSKGNQTAFKGVPADCGDLVDAWTAFSPPNSSKSYWLDASNFGQDLTAPSGGLFGGAAIVNSSAGTMYSYDATALAGFTASQLHNAPGTVLPSLNSGTGGFSKNGYVFTDNGNPLEASFSRTVDSVSYVFMHDAIMNEYNTEELLNASSEWVVTFPTKRFYVDEDVVDPTLDFVAVTGSVQCDGVGDPVGCTTGESSTISDLQCWTDDVTPPALPANDPDCRKLTWGEVGPLAPFTDVWDGEACEEVVLTGVYDRNEQTFGTSTTPSIPPIVSPAPPGVQPADRIPFEVCAETNVIRFGAEIDGLTATEILGSSSFTNFDTEELGFENGWVKIDLTTFDVDDSRDALGNLLGLPVAGFWVERFVNTTLQGGSVQANYGGIFKHKGTRQTD